MKTGREGIARQAGHGVRAGLAATVAVVALGSASVSAPDLDVGVPPGSPLEWGQAFPALTPTPGPLYPVSQSGEPDRSRSAPARPEPQVEIATSFGIVRILTWDLAAHIAWIQANPLPGPISGSSNGVAHMPDAGSALYWVTLAPLLRMLLHPKAVSRPALVAHLCEVGEPVLGVLGAARREPALRPLCDQVEALVQFKEAGSLVPFEDEDTEQNMLLGIVYEELRRAHPYDPEGDFGSRLFLFGDDLEPYVARYLDHSDGFIRRNAVAALARYRTDSASEALFGVAATSEDPVMFVRALSALGRHRTKFEVLPLMERAISASDDVERVALVAALGRIGDSRAVTALTALGEKARRKDADMLVAVFSALANIRGGESKEAILELARKAAHAPPGRDERGLGGNMAPDVPDPGDLKARAVEQLAYCVILRREPDDETAITGLFEYLPEGTGIVDTSAWGNRYTNSSLGGIAMVAAFDVLDALDGLGERGEAVLRRVAEDRTAEPTVRGFAMSRLDWTSRTELAAEILERETESLEMKGHALARLAEDRGEALEEVARELVAECARAASGSGSDERRYLWMVALQALEKSGKLEMEDLLSVLHHARAPKDLWGEFYEQVVEEVDALIELGVAGAPRNRLRGPVTELVERVRELGVNEGLNEDNERDYKKSIEQMLLDMRAHRSNPGAVQGVRLSILERLFGHQVARPNSAMGEFETYVPLARTILMALGRSKEPWAVHALTELLDHRSNRHRSVVCLALGVAGDEKGAKAVVSYLLDEDPFVRYCAYSSMRELTGKDFAADWMFGDRADYVAQAERYFQWVNEEL